MGRTFKPLVRDLGTTIGEVLRLEAEIVAAWEGGRGGLGRPRPLFAPAQCGRRLHGTSRWQRGTRPL